MQLLFALVTLATMVVWASVSVSCSVTAVLNILYIVNPRCPFFLILRVCCRLTCIPGIWCTTWQQTRGYFDLLFIALDLSVILGWKSVNENIISLCPLVKNENRMSVLSYTCAPPGGRKDWGQREKLLINERLFLKRDAWSGSISVMYMFGGITFVHCRGRFQWNDLTDVW